MLTNIHLLLSYNCSLRCQHCYIYAGPRAHGAMTRGQVSEILSEAQKINSVKWIYFNGGEPFMHNPQLLHCINKAVQMGFLVGVVTNGFFARTEQSALRFLRPLKQLGVSELRISNDSYHYKSPGPTPAQYALKVAQELGIKVIQLRVRSPFEQTVEDVEPIESIETIDVPLRYQGRANDTLTSGLPRTSWKSFSSCPLEDLSDPERIFIDAYGNAQRCPGISLGNIWETPLSTLVNTYQVVDHPIYGPITQGGPAFLAETFSYTPQAGYVDACQLCYNVRKQLLAIFPDVLGPNQVYGL
jgi:organic radical activating enzyme